MSTLVISLVVVGGAIAIVVWLTTGEAPQPATDDPETDRASEPEPEPPEPEPEPPENLETASPEADGLEAVPHEKEPDAAPEPPAATPPPAPPTGRRRPKPVVVDGPVRESAGDRRVGVSLLRRARSGLMLIVIVAVVGLGVAAVVGTVAVMISRALESAVK